MDHPIQGLMKAAMENLKEMVDVNTIVGEPVQTADGGVVLTVSKVAFGFGAGGSDFQTNDGQRTQGNPAFGGGSAGGVSITPVAFLVVNKDGVNILHLQNGTHLAEKVIELAPQTIDKIQSIFQKNEKHDEPHRPQNPDEIA
ncbi:sporulation protein YtfJ [Bacillus pseudomycoides]|uniref:Sporulation protein YtfJ n=1 Tax=Bacillus pseudomycoides TaxID=64104 RepID=A0AA91VD52_9BACI|nr:MULTISPECIES: GerW family sporulation protein [Bacillus]PEB48019.1 sporulation protein YtfJ [Bacillus sp. AFS098217]PED82897.1 sporulation protein YtfJ [Bacillus pseudomycoides]PEU09734.1 sporulation protein YtfJ [Bacillus sp. AFS019443]PEU18429.1 sporulation protein YtfJ [Bacillus sp. AFS014408]PFW62673.1 sporulation protein YtfJ [Bacillus sp. AFS075034]